MPKTRFERMETGRPETAGFRISGKLGFHENVKIEHLVDECLKRSFSEVLFDFTDLSSLGGGVAKILRQFIKDLGVKGGSVKFVIKNSVILDFLQDDNVELLVFESVEDAWGADAGSVSGETYVDPALFSGDIGGGFDESRDRDEWDGTGIEEDSIILAKADELFDKPGGSELDEDIEASGPQDVEEAGIEHAAAFEEPSPDRQVDDSDVILMSYDGFDRLEKESEGEASSESDTAVKGAGSENGIISEIFEEESAEEIQASPKVARVPERKPSTEDKLPEDLDQLNRKLKRRILELKTLFLISADFNAIKDKKKLLDIFLLTSIAQGGVESAAFFEKVDDKYFPSIIKGFEESETTAFRLDAEVEKKIAGTYDVAPISSGPFETGLTRSLSKVGLEYFCPFMIKEGIAGLIFLGKRIAGRGMKKEDFEFMKILINVATGAYQNALMLEREHERTLGIVKTLISLIEENTLLKGMSEFVSRYVGMVAKNMDYPEEHFKDLIYGTVLRDMGMIKVSDLIVRSPRELTREEWGIINKHPEDGAEMLKRMKFSGHVLDIVFSHHERFNGEGYPRGLRGKEIPLGSRIISVVESYAAMIHERPNRPALSSKEALESLKENYGLRYDREVVNQFISIMEKEMARSVRPGVAVS